MTQGQLDFSVSGDGAGLAAWREERLRTRRELASRLGVPLGRQVEVWLKDGVRLRGLLHLREDLLLVTDRHYELELEVDGVRFRHSDLESCVVAEQ